MPNIFSKYDESKDSLVGAFIGAVEAESIKSTGGGVDELSTNGDFAEWLEGELPNDWDFDSADDGAIDITEIYKSEDSFAGNYALGLETSLEFTGLGFLTPILGRGQNEWGDGDTIQVTGQSKVDSGAISGYLLLSCRNGEDDYEYHWTGVNAGTFQLAGEAPSSETLLDLSVAASYGGFDTGVITFPAGSSNGDVIILGVSEVAGAKVLFDNVDIKINTVSQTTNSGFEDWSLEAFAPPAGFDTGELAYSEGDHSKFFAESIVKEEGLDYSAGIEIKSDSGPYYGQLIENVSNDVVVSLSAACDEGMSARTLTTVILNNTPELATKAIDFDTGEFTDLGEGASLPDRLSESQGDENELSASFKTFNYSVKAPETEKVYAIMIAGSSDMGAEVYIGRFFIGTSDAIFLRSSAQDIEALPSIAILAQDKVGEFTVDEVRASGERVTDFDTFDFSSKEVEVGMPSDPTNLGENSALNSYTGSRLLSITEFDLKVTGAKKVLGAGDYIITGIYTVTTAADSLSGDALGSLGTNSTDYNNMLSEVQFPQFARGVREIGLSSYGLGDSNQDIYFNLSTADTGTSGTAKVYIFGVII